MEEFNLGWWNCFNSFVKEMFELHPRFSGDICNDTTILDNVLKGAGVTEEEIKEVIKTDLFDESFSSYLKKYIERNI